MKISSKVLASASAFVVCLSSSLGATTTNGWFSVEGFEDEAYVIDGPVAGVQSWTSSGANDASSIIDIDDGEPAVKGHATDKIVKLDTQGDQLTWTPASPSSDNVVLIDTDVYLVGADEAPNTDPNGVQTEVFLKNILDANDQVVDSVLCAHVHDTVGGTNAWIELDGIEVQHQTWVKLRIEINYEGPFPLVSFWVNDIRMEQAGTSTLSFRIMDANKTAVSSIAFMGTGYIDNFLGQQFTPSSAGPVINPPLVNMNGGSSTSGGTIDTVTTPGMLFATFDSVLGGEPLQYVQLTNQDGTYVRTYRTADGSEVEFDTSNLEAGTYNVTAYYGDAPSVVPGDYVPEAEAAADKPAAEIATEGSVKILRVNIHPVSGLYYTLFVGTDGAQPGGLSAAADSVLAYPDDEDNGFLQIKMPAPTTPNGVSLIKIYASDEAYEAGDPAPDSQ